MSKRKREPHDSSEGGAPHQKVRVQEIPHVGASSNVKPDEHESARKSAKLEKRVEKRKRRTLAKADRSNDAATSKKLVESSPWTLSEPAGGQMLDLDPLFSDDEKHILIPFASSVHVYSTSTSLLVRKLHARESISAVSLLPSGKLFVTTHSGLIEKWDWRSGSKCDVWQISSQIYTCTTSTEKDLLYTIDKKSAGQWLLTAHRLVKSGHDAITDVKTLRRHDNRLSGIRVLNGGRTIVATSQSQLLIGTCRSPCPPELKDLKYIWRDVDCPEWIASFDVREDGKSLDVVIGGVQGSIYVYDDLLAKLSRQESSAEVKISSRRLHWHRNKVLSVKWSLDGIYIISGGQETVLVVWQLETGQKQDLPHLGAPIESIVVSPKGAAYGVRLADNSTMILSTAELQPSFSVATMHFPLVSNSRHLPFIPTVDAPRPVKAKPRHYAACTVNHGADQLLLAVPSSTASSSQDAQSASYLQTCEVGTGQQISRQALTRTKITTLNIGPESNTIEDPHITQLQATSDGRWLATIEEWEPPTRDLSPYSYDPDRTLDKQTHRQEVFLKFWSWNEETKIWELVSRVDSPHASEAKVNARILTLAASPSDHKFSTIDKEGCIKFWTSSERKRNGLTVKKKGGGEVLSNWRCQQTVQLACSAKLATAHLAYSPDGSLLSVSPPEGPITLVNAISGRIHSTQPDISSGLIQGVGVLGKYLIVLSGHLAILDLVTQNVVADLDLHSEPSSLPQHHLSISHTHNILALSFPAKKDSGQGRSDVVVFSGETFQPLCLRTYTRPISKILPAARKGGFYILSTNGEISSLFPTSKPPKLPALEKREPTQDSGIENIFKGSFGNLTQDRDTLTSSRQNREYNVEGNGQERVVTREQLTEVFETRNGSALAMPPIEELFEQVASLFQGRKAA